MKAAGRELDALIAEKVMGLELKQPDKTNYRRDTWVYAINDYTDEGPVYVVDCPEYSTDIAAAWEVLEKLSDSQITVNRHMHSGYTVGVFEKVQGISIQEKCSASAATAPLAICLAALKAVGYEA